jgi:SAM-dependent methyltransferase
MPILQDREQKLELIQEMSSMTPAQLSMKYWGLGYQFTMSSGCPPDSNPHLVARARGKIPFLAPADVILDIGSGRQHFVSLLNGSPSFPAPPNRFITLDITPIDAVNLTKRPNVSHTRADATKLPFGDNTIGLIASNMAADYVQDRESFDKELFRVLKLDHSAILTLMRPSMFSENPEHFIDKLESVRDIHDYLLTRFLIDNRVLTNSETEIRQRFMKQGFEVVDVVQRVQGGVDPIRHPMAPSWWEVELKKRQKVA